MLYGDSLAALNAARASYVQGNDFATILAVQACLEKELAGLLHLSMIKPNAQSLAALLDQAHEFGILDASELKFFQRLRQARNSHAHFRDVNARDHPVRRMMETGVGEHQALREDARTAIHALLGLLNRPPFGLGPIEYLSDAELWGVVHPDQMALAV